MNDTNGATEVSRQLKLVMVDARGRQILPFSASDKSKGLKGRKLDVVFLDTSVIEERLAHDFLESLRRGYEAKTDGNNKFIGQVYLCGTDRIDNDPRTRLLMEYYGGYNWRLTNKELEMIEEITALFQPCALLSL